MSRFFYSMYTFRLRSALSCEIQRLRPAFIMAQAGMYGNVIVCTELMNYLTDIAVLMLSATLHSYMYSLVFDEILVDLKENGSHSFCYNLCYFDKHVSSALL